MATLCATFEDEDRALAVVRALMERGVPGEDVRLLRGTPLRDARKEPRGSFVSDHPSAAHGTFAGTGGDAAEGSFAGGDARERRLGSFGDVDQDYAESFPGGVEDVSRVSHHGLVGMLTRAGVDEARAHRDVDFLHEGRVVVLALVEPDREADAAEILSGGAD